MDDLAARRYLKCVGLFLGLGWAVISLYIGTQPMRYADRAYALWSHSLAFARGEESTARDCAMACDPRVLILGDSRAQAALIPETIGPDTRSLALMSATPIDTYYLLRDYLEHHDAPDWIVLSFAPYHLQRIDERVFWNVPVKFGAHRFGDFLEIVDRSVQLAEPLRAGAGKARMVAEWLLYRAKFPPFYLAELEEAGWTGRRYENTEALSELIAQRGHYLFGRATRSAGISKEAELEGFRESKLVDRYLRDGIALAERAGSRVLLRAMPINETSRRRVATRFANEYRRYIESLRRDFPHMFASSEIDALPDSHFGDGSHVNQTGARRVSREVATFLAHPSPMLADVALGR